MDLEFKGFDDMDFKEEDFLEFEVPEVDNTKESYSKLGDLWLLGKHRLLCGDSTDKETVERLMNGKKADMIFTDPPYLMDFEGSVHADGSKSHNGIHGNIKNDKMTRENGDIFVEKIISTIKENVLGAYYICFYRLGIDYVFRALDKNKLKYRGLIIWDKGNHTLSNSDYMSKYEPIVYGWIKEHNFYGEKANFDIWSIDRTKKNDLHPTMKPLELVLKAINDSTKREDVVLDLFGGSGSTLIGAEQTNRICYMMELDEKYIDVIVKRYNNLDKTDIKLIRDGKEYEWSEVEKEIIGV